MDERRDHVIREPLPWRDERLTECGRQIMDVASTITREQLQSRLNKEGQQRTAFTVCMTCYHHLHDNWDVDPVGAIKDEGSRTGWPKTPRYTALGEVPRPIGRRDTTNDRLLVYELHAMARLVEAHRDEFDQLVTELIAGAEWRDRLAKRRKT